MTFSRLPVRMWRKLSLLQGVLAVGLFLSACAGSQPVESAGAPPATGDTAVGTEMLNFSAPALSGGTVEGADYAGKDLALWFWAPW